jgi:hypothetical protein
VLAICFGGIVIDKDVQSDFDYVLRWCCDWQGRLDRTKYNIVCLKNKSVTYLWLIYYYYLFLLSLYQPLWSTPWTLDFYHEIDYSESALHLFHFIVYIVLIIQMLKIIC